MLHAQLGQVQVGVFKTTCCLKLDEACSSAGITLYLCSFILQQLLLSTVRIWNKLGLWSDSKTYALRIPDLVQDRVSLPVNLC